VLAKAIGQQTPFPSLEVATEDFSTSIGACDTGYSCTYMNTISWASPTSPLPMEITRVCSSACSAARDARAALARMRENRSILDAVTASTKTFRTGLGKRDQARLSDYLDNVREIERRIQRAAQRADSDPVALAAPVGPPEAYDEHVAIMFDLLAAAFQVDATRVFTFMMMRDISSRSFPHIGVSDPHHALSHEANGRSKDPQKPVNFAKVNTHHVSLFAKFVEKLKATPEGDGSLLDHSMVLYGSAMGNANDHTHHPLPLVVVGGGSGQMKKAGHHLVYPDLTPTANLLLTLAQKVGVETERVGISTGPFDM
jgi:hypothetical protein